jgi:NitT/TauT family transport system substrate-binding protein
VFRSTRRAALTAAALALAAGTRARAAGKPRGLPLKVAVMPNDDAALPFYARETGVFERAGLDAEIRLITDPVAMRAALATGGLDIGYGDVVAAAIAHENDPPLVFLAASSVYVAREAATGVLVAGRTSPIRTAADLEGKRVAVESATGLSALALRRWIDTHGGNSTRVTLVEASGTGLVEAVTGGKADAAVVQRAAAPSTGRDADPLRAIANTFDAVAGRWIQSAWLTTPAWIVRHPDAAEAFAAAMKETASWANAHHHESAVILARVLKSSPARIEALPRAEYAVGMTPGLIEPVIELCAKYGVIARTFPAADLIDPLAR